MNENENTTSQNFVDVDKAMLNEKCLTVKPI